MAGDPVVPEELVLHLVRLVDSHPRLPFDSIAKYHHSRPHLHTADSFNVILELACRSSHTRHFQAVYDAMRDRGLGDHTSTRLYIRHLARTGQGEKALEVLRSLQEPEIPNEIMLELVRVPAKHLRRHLGREKDLHKLPTLSSPVIKDLAGLYSALYLPPDDPLVLPLLKALIDHLLYLRRFRDAFVLTQHALTLLPPEPSRTQLRHALSLIHGHLALPPATISRKPHPEAIPFERVLQLIEAHPSLHPTSLTLALALEWYRRRKHRGYLSYSLLREWRKRWGEGIEDSRVRRKIAGFALEERNIVLVRKMINREFRMRKQLALGDDTGLQAVGLERGWEIPRNDDLWGGVLDKYQKLQPKRGWTDDPEIWNSMQHAP